MFRIRVRTPVTIFSSFICCENLLLWQYPGHPSGPLAGTLFPPWDQALSMGPSAPHTPPHSLHTLQQLLKSLVLRVLCMIVTGRARGLISAVSPSKALAVYSGLQGGRQGLSLPRHHAFPCPPHPRESLQQGWQLVWAPHRKARLTGSGDLAAPFA